MTLFKPPRASRGRQSRPGRSALLSADGLVKVYRADGVAVHAIRGVDIHVRRGEFNAVMGPSGSGKSTLLHLLGGLEPPTSGQLWLDGRRVDRISQAAWAILRRQHVGFVFQFFSLISNMTVADNVELPALLGGSPAAAHADFDKAQELQSGKSVFAYVALALVTSNGAERQRLLDGALAIDVEKLTSRRLTSLIAQRYARALTHLSR